MSKAGPVQMDYGMVLVTQAIFAVVTVSFHSTLMEGDLEGVKGLFQVHDRCESLVSRLFP